jgi:hypothetical protein
MMRPSSAPAPLPLLALAGFVTLGLLGGCSLYPLSPVTQELQVDTVALAPRLTYGVSSTPFCLHLRYRNDFKVVYSQHEVEAWATDGACAAKGARRHIETLALSWRYDGYTQQDKLCGSADTCTMADQRLIEGRLIQCVSARARDGDQSAFLSSDQANCR